MKNIDLLSNQIKTETPTQNTNQTNLTANDISQIAKEVVRIMQAATETPKTETVNEQNVDAETENTETNEESEVVENDD